MTNKSIETLTAKAIDKYINDFMTKNVVSACEKVVEKACMKAVEPLFEKFVGKTLDGYIREDMDERIKFVVETVLQYKGLSPALTHYLITYGIVNYGRYSENDRRTGFETVCRTVWKTSQEGLEERYAA